MGRPVLYPVQPTKKVIHDPRGGPPHHPLSSWERTSPRFAPTSFFIIPHTNTVAFWVPCLRTPKHASLALTTFVAADYVPRSTPPSACSSASRHTTPRAHP